jgi:RNA polymerase sigma factor (sigma-70 family)
MSDDRQLLRRFAEERSEAAFGELVTRHLPLVYSTAIRQAGGDEHLAKDVAQLVFTDLARKAPGLSENIILAGWLHRATIFAARQTLRGDRRRREREQQAVIMNAVQSESESADWQQIRPLLDEALDRLGKADRDALLLRFFEQQSFSQIGANLGGSEDAARKRITRALEKLRTILQKHGVTTTVAALSTVVSANAIQTVPVGLASVLTNTSLAAAATGTTFTLLKIMTATQLKLGLGALVVAGATTAIVIQHQMQSRLLAENQSLHQQLAQLQNDNNDLSNRLADAGDAKKLTDDQFNELLRLRGEVGRLRNQAGQVQKLQNDNQELQAQLANAPTQPAQLAPEDQYQLHQMHMTTAMKQVALAIRIYEGDNNMQAPTNLDQLARYLEPNTNGFSYTYTVGNPDFIGMDNFELMNVGSVNINLPLMLMIRERTPRRNPNGEWERIYAFADGSVQTINSDDGNFDVYERQHSAAAETSNQSPQ